MRVLSGISFLLVFLTAAALLFGCSREGQELPDAADTDPTLLPFRSAYRLHCGSCHGRNGAGAPHLFPPLRGSGWVTGDPSVPIRVVLHGLEGRVLVEGGDYVNTMPPLGGRLKDEDIAGILTYVRGSWGNLSPPITPEDVAHVRSESAGRKKPWTARELGFPTSADSVVRP